MQPAGCTARVGISRVNIIERVSIADTAQPRLTDAEIKKYVHNIILSDTDDLWAWGSNRYGCLGAPKGKEPPAGYTATPIMIDCFNTMINRVGDRCWKRSEKRLLYIYLHHTKPFFRSRWSS